MIEDDLDLVTTEDLLQALKRRQGEGGAVLVVTCDSNNYEKITYMGGATLCLGLAFRAQHFIMSRYDKPLDPEGT